jgi:hypothetical protein
MRVDNYMISANKVFYFVLIWFMISCVYSCTWRELSSIPVLKFSFGLYPWTNHLQFVPVGGVSKML